MSYIKLNRFWEKEPENEKATYLEKFVFLIGEKNIF